MFERTPAEIDRREFGQHLQLIDTDWTSRTMRPDTILAALMQQGPSDAYVESVEELHPLHEAIQYGITCISAQDIWILNAINSEGVTFGVLGSRLGLSASQAHRLHKQAMQHLRTILLSHPTVRERLQMEPTWESAAMHELVHIASYENDWPTGTPTPTPADAACDIAAHVGEAVAQLNGGFELFAVESLTEAARTAVGFCRSVGKWNLLAMHELVCGKQNDYGHGNIQKFGMVGVMVRASDKAERLLNLSARQGVAPRNESLLDSFYDTIGYAMLARMLKAETFELQLESTTERESAA